MRLSNLFGKTQREVPAEADTANHRLMLRAGIIRQLTAGVYSYLPLGSRVLKKMEAIIREKVDSFKQDLSEREVYILENRIFSDTPATLQEIGEHYGITRERVRQIENSMIKKMRTHFQSEIPDFESFIGELGTDGT